MGMSATDANAAGTTWDDPERCPYCNDAITDGGSGFIDHISEKPTCQQWFETWRGRVRDDMAGGWGG